MSNELIVQPDIEQLDDKLISLKYFGYYVTKENKEFRMIDHDDFITKKTFYYKDSQRKKNLYYDDIKKLRQKYFNYLSVTKIFQNNINKFNYFFDMNAFFKILCCDKQLKRFFYKKKFKNRCLHKYNFDTFYDSKTNNDFIGICYYYKCECVRPQILSFIKQFYKKKLVCYISFFIDKKEIKNEERSFTNSHLYLQPKNDGNEWKKTIISKKFLINFFEELFNVSPVQVDEETYYDNWAKKIMITPDIDLSKRPKSKHKNLY
jgi:hypothetical protein